MSTPRWRPALLLLMLGCTLNAHAQTALGAAVNSVTGQPALSELYPITINLAAVTKAGVTPGAGYVLVRDLKRVITARQSGTGYVLETPGSSLRFTPGSRLAALNGYPAKLSAQPVRIPDSLLFPLSSLPLLGCTYQPLAAMSDLRPYRVTCADTSVILAAVTFKNGNPPASALEPAPRVINQLRTAALQSD